MVLSQLLQTIATTQRIGDVEREIDQIEIDSRKVGKNTLFVAIKGSASDGHNYIEKAIEQGATAIVCEVLPTQLLSHVCYAVVTDSAEAVGHLASEFYENPSLQLVLVGVTGTNGKTTIATLLYELFRFLGYKVGLLSTVCNYIDNTPIEATHTTPDPITLNKLLHEMVEHGCTHAFMEVSSHAIDQRRIAGLSFDGGVFTNLTRDHLDYHGTVDAYLKAKKRFFDDLPSSAFALTNVDDKTGMVMLQNTQAQKLTYSLRTLANFKARILERDFAGTLLDINGTELFVRFVGRFNAYNLLAVYGAAIALGEESEEVLIEMSKLIPVSGRFQTINAPQGFTVIVDYAHTPDALNNVLSTINDVMDGNGKIITVVGCGGNRDKGKRPIMAQEAVNGSTTTILTSDNPRFEQPEDILADMVAGLNNTQRRATLEIVDRRQAIKTALTLAQTGDVVLIAGKGHENYQDVQGVKHHFDDREEVSAYIESCK